jgi:hypothetical protein
MKQFQRRIGQIFAQPRHIKYCLAVLYAACATLGPSDMLGSSAFAAPGETTKQTVTLGTQHVSVIQDDAGRFWFQHHSKERFFSMGINTINGKAWNPRPETVHYDAVAQVFGGDRAAWNKSVRSILTDHGFNTIGAWSDADAAGVDAPMLRTPILYVAGHAPDRPLHSLRPGFAEMVERNTREALQNFPDHSKFLGLFLDNEAAWFGVTPWTRVPTQTLLEIAVDLPKDDAARVEAIKVLSSRHGDFAAFAKAWDLASAFAPGDSWDAVNSAALRRSATPAAMADRSAFVSLAADRFFDVASPIVRRLAPSVLLLGVRFAGDAPDEVIRAVGRTQDVMSLNHYARRGASDDALLSRFWLEGKRPIMITEFSFRSAQNLSGNKNTRGAARVLETQAERAALYSSLVADLASRPIVIGAHWFEWADQSPQGRFDGEDSNYGVVSIKHEPYNELLSAMAATNFRIKEVRTASTRPIPDKIMQRPIVINSGPGPAASLPLSMMKDWTEPPATWGASDASMQWGQAADGLTIKYDAGTLWGVALTLSGPESAAGAPQKNADGEVRALNFAGATSIVVDADIPAGLLVNLTIDEASGNDRGRVKSLNFGDDGEAFINEPSTASGGRKTYRFPLESFRQNIYAGNQDGPGTLDLFAIRRIAIQVQGSPRTGEIRVFDVRVE